MNHNKLTIVFFEKQDVESLHPVTLTRPGFDILCGGTTLFDLVKREFPQANITWLVRDYLAKVTQQKRGHSVIKAGDKVLFLDASLSPSVAEVRALEARIKSGKNFVLNNKGRLTAVFIDYQNEIKKLKQADVERWLSKQKVKNLAARWPRFEHLWEIITLNNQLLRSNLELLYKPGVSKGRDASLAKHVLFDASAGPIVIGDNVEIASFVNLVGPLFVGHNCKIREFSVIKAACLGPFCKVGGEIEAAVMQGYSNKQHQGALAHSYVGEWVNIGGGTAASDLKNTYGTVKMRGQDTREQFLGCVIGDYSKTAVNVAIYCGKIIGVNSFIFDTVTRDVPSFTNHLGRLGQSVAVDLAVAIRAQKAMMARRKVKQAKADIELLKNVFKMTEAERNQAKIKKGKLSFHAGIS